MLGSDEILKVSGPLGRESLFNPLLGAGLNKILPGPLHRELKAENFVHKNWSELNNTSRDLKFSGYALTEINSMRGSGGLAEDDYNELRNTFLDFKNASLDQQKSISK